MANRETADQIMDAATEWVSRLDRGLSADEQAALQRWSDTDVRHAGALARAQALWVHAQRLRVLGPKLRMQVAQTRRPRPRVPLRWAWAAGTLVMAGVAVFMLQTYTRTHLATALGEVRRVPLSDGSAVTLDTRSRIVLEYTKAARIVRLDSGEAIFDVSHDELRPFIVEAGTVRVRAVGTAFVVRRESDSNVQVTVTRGVVDVWRQDSVTEPATRVTADSRVVASSSEVTPVLDLTEAEVARSVAWQDGILDLEGRTLAQAATEFNRYNDQMLVIEDPVLARQPVVGRFRTNDPRGFASAAAAMLDAHVRIEPDRIVLERTRLP